MAWQSTLGGPLGLSRCFILKTSLNLRPFEAGIYAPNQKNPENRKYWNGAIYSLRSPENRNMNDFSQTMITFGIKTWRKFGGVRGAASFTGKWLYTIAIFAISVVFSSPLAAQTGLVAAYS